METASKDKQVDVGEARNTFIHFLMGVHGFTKQNEDKGTQKCIDEALVWFNTLTSQIRAERDREIVAVIEGIKLVDNPNKLIPRDIASHNVGYNKAIDNIITTLKNPLDGN